MRLQKNIVLFPALKYETSLKKLCLHFHTNKLLFLTSFLFPSR